MSRLSKFLLGDWLRYANKRWGDCYVRAARLTGYDVKTLYKIVHVSTRVEPFLRRKKLSWSHHALLASLERDEQIRWLDAAEEHRWSVEDMRIEMRTALRIQEPASQGELDDDHREPTAAVSSRAASTMLIEAVGLADEIVCPKCGERLVGRDGAQA
jgi:hypothetical protein